MGKSCKECAQSLFECLKETKCVKDGGEIRDCLKLNTTNECQELRAAYLACKKGGLDMRSRLRGVRVY